MSWHRARTILAGLCLTFVAIVLSACEVTSWAEGTLLSPPGLVASLRGLPATPAFETDFTSQVTHTLHATIDDRVPSALRPLLDQTGALQADLLRSVASYLSSPGFERVWILALTNGDRELVSILRHENDFVSASGPGLVIHVPVALKALRWATSGLEGLGVLPKTLTIAIPVADRRGLRHGQQFVRIVDDAHQILVPSGAALVLVGLVVTRRRRRAVVAASCIGGVVAAVVLAGVYVVGHRSGAGPIASIVTRAVLAPLRRWLVVTTASCAAVAGGLLTFRRARTIAGGKRRGPKRS